MDANDVYSCFDYEDKVHTLISDLKLLPEVSCQLVAKGNSHKTLNSYSWSLCKMLFEMRNNNSKGIFDLVYLDGSHSFIHDGLSCCILKELLKDKGIIIFDDMYWSYENRPTCNPKVSPGTSNLFTEEQIKDCQVKRVVEAFMIDDKRFKQIYIKGISNNDRAIFQKD